MNHEKEKDYHVQNDSNTIENSDGWLSRSQFNNNNHNNNNKPGKKKKNHVYNICNKADQREEEEVE